MSTTVGAELKLEHGYIRDVEFTFKNRGAIYDLENKTVVLRVGHPGQAALFELELDVVVLTGVASGTITGVQSAQEPGSYEYHVVVVEDDWLAIRGPCSVRDTIDDI